MRRLAVVLLAGLYLGMSNYCLGYALVMGQAHHGIVSSGEVTHHPDQGQEHGAHHGQAPAHDADDSSDSCCAAYNAPGVIVPSAPQLLPRSDSSVLPAFFVVAAIVPTAIAGPSLRRFDHGPPGAAAQDAPLFCRAPRAPPTLA